MGEREVKKAELGMRPPAPPSCRLYLRAGSHRGHRDLHPGGNGEYGKVECGMGNERRGAPERGDLETRDLGD